MAECWLKHGRFCQECGKPFSRSAPNGVGYALSSGALLTISDKLDSLNSIGGKIKKMGPVFKFLVDGAQSPIVQLSVFILGAVWIGTAAILSARKSGSSFRAVTFGDALLFSPDDNKVDLLRHMDKPSSAQLSCVTVSYNKDSMDCVWPVTFRNQNEIKGMIARLRVDSETKSNIPVCKAAITSLEANSRTLVSGVQLSLLFTPTQSSGSDTKPIRYGQPEYLEVIWIPEAGDAAIMANFPFAFDECKTLNRLSAYSLCVAFSVDNIISRVILDAAYTSGVWMLSIRPHSRSTRNREASPLPLTS